MNAVAFLEDLRQRGALIQADHGDVVVAAPPGVLTTELRSTLVDAKDELLEVLLAPSKGPFAPLVEYAASLLPKIRFTIHETGDTRRDFDLLGAARRLIREFQPGGNHVRLQIVTLDGRRVVVGWRALATRDLRLALARLLARTAIGESDR